MWDIPIGDSTQALIAKPWKAVMELVKYVMFGKSLFSEPFVHMAIFLPTRLLGKDSEILSSDPQDLDSSLPRSVPDVELKPMAISGIWPEVPRSGGVFTVMVCLLQPKSHGTVCLNSGDPYERPKCDLRLLSAPEDVAVLNKGVRLAVRLSNHIRAQGYPIKDLVVPASYSDEDVDSHIRAYASTGYHYASSCRMAPFGGSHLGVVDDDLRVHGVEGLRICDTSVFPEILAAHTMAPVVAVAEKCADMIKASYVSVA
jgi:choline dehydrogenase-like flavoprotein